MNWGQNQSYLEGRLNSLGAGEKVSVRIVGENDRDYRILRGAFSDRNISVDESTRTVGVELTVKEAKNLDHISVTSIRGSIYLEDVA